MEHLSNIVANNGNNVKQLVKHLNATIWKNCLTWPTWTCCWCEWGLTAVVRYGRQWYNLCMSSGRGLWVMWCETDHLIGANVEHLELAAGSSNCGEHVIMWPRPTDQMTTFTMSLSTLQRPATIHVYQSETDHSHHTTPEYTTSKWNN